MTQSAPSCNPGLTDSGQFSQAKSPRSQTRRRGAVLVLILIFLPVLVILCGFAINWAHIQLARTELQVAVDASARAANRVYVATGDLNQAVAAAQRVADNNLVDRHRLVLSKDDFELGASVRNQFESRYEFTPGDRNANALRLTVNKESESPSGPVNLVFPVLNGSRQVNISASAISTQIELDIALVIDRSGSMAYAADEKAVYPPIPKAAPAGWYFGDPVPPKSRWLDTITAVRVFLTELNKSPQNERVSLITYADSARLDLDLTGDYARIVSALDNYSKQFNSGGTNIGGGLARANNNLATSKQARPWATKVIIVMTDGIHNTGSNPVTQATDIAKNGVMIFTVTFSAEANQSTMKRVAEIGGGTHYHAKSAKDLQVVFEEIAKKMPTLITQ